MEEYVCKNCGEIKEGNMQRLSDEEKKEMMKKDSAVIIVFTVLFVTIMILWRILWIAIKT